MSIAVLKKDSKIMRVIQCFCEKTVSSNELSGLAVSDFKKQVYMKLSKTKAGETINIQERLEWL